LSACGTDAITPDRRSCQLCHHDPGRLGQMTMMATFEELAGGTEVVQELVLRIAGGR
jgi:hypothetical protein